MGQGYRIALSFPGCHRRGGVERIVFECARFFAGNGHKVTVFANEWEEDTEQAGIKYEYVPMRSTPSFLRRTSYFKNASRQIAASSPDVLNTHGCVCPFDGVLRVHSLHREWLKQSRIRRGAYSPGGIKQKLNPVHYALLRMESMHFRDRRYRKVIALSAAVRDSLKEHYNVPESDVEIIPNGFAPLEFNPEIRSARRAAMREQIGLKSDDIALTFIANELERKGYSTILDAMVRLKRPDVRLVVVGRVDKAQVNELADRVGVRDQVIYCGPTTDVAGYHAAGDLFVLPTQYEAFCLAILEALGSGLPVVTSSVPGARDPIIPGINGSIISNPDSGDELANAIVPFLDRDYREKVSSTTPQSVIQYQWPQVLSAYEAMILKYGVS